MLTQKQIDTLKRNWGDKAEAMACNAEVRIFDTDLPDWDMYLVAMDPEDDETILAIIDSAELQYIRGNYYDLEQIFAQGDGVTIDKAWRPRNAADLYRKLQKRKGL